MHFTLLSIELLELWHEYTFTTLEVLQDNCHVLHAGEGFANEFFGSLSKFSILQWLFLAFHIVALGSGKLVGFDCGIYLIIIH